METQGPNWTAIGALIISAMALGRSFLSDRRSKRLERLTRASSRFESDFGEPVRESLRAFEKSLKTLRTFLYVGGKTPDDMKAEIYSLRPDWEDAAGEVDRLLREMDGAQLVTGTNWSSAFRTHTERAESSLESIASATQIDFALIRGYAGQAHDSYQESLRCVRSMLETQRNSYEDNEKNNVLVKFFKYALWPD